MKSKFTLTAQLSTGHSLPENLTKEKVLPMLRKALDVVPLDILIVGWVEMPELYHALIDRDKRQVDQVFLWYPMLSDYPGMNADQFVIDYQGHASRGWGDFLASGEMSETFRFACPNNPDAVGTSLANLERLLSKYDFDGVFLDKIRFPSPANGLPEVFSCFCPHCLAAAEQWGLDLKKVKQSLDDPHFVAFKSASHAAFPGARWLEILFDQKPLLQDFIQFRCDSITRVVDEVNALLVRLHKKLALDVYTPALAPLVGQDLPKIAGKAAWVKPMIYRFAKGPASLRLEIPQLIRGMAAFMDCSSNDICRWIDQNVEGFSPCDLNRIENEGVPLDWVRNESAAMLKLVSSVPVYLGSESVKMPGVIDITPKNIKEIIELVSSVGLQGMALSWDLLHTPLENLQPLKEVR